MQRLSGEFPGCEVVKTCLPDKMPGNYLLRRPRESRFVRYAQSPISLPLPDHSSRGTAIKPYSFASFGRRGLASANKAGQ
jgi:hypothetical protein